MSINLLLYYETVNVPVTVNTAVFVDPGEGLTALAPGVTETVVASGKFIITLPEPPAPLVVGPDAPAVIAPPPPPELYLG